MAAAITTMTIVSAIRMTIGIAKEYKEYIGYAKETIKRFIKFINFIKDYKRRNELVTNRIYIKLTELFKESLEKNHKKADKKTKNILKKLRKEIFILDTIEDLSIVKFKDELLHFVPETNEEDKKLLLF